MGDVAGVIAEIACFVEQDADVGRRPVDRRQVDRAIEVTKAVIVGFALMQRRRQRRDDTLPDESD